MNDESPQPPAQPKTKHHRPRRGNGRGRLEQRRLEQRSAHRSKEVRERRAAARAAVHPRLEYPAQLPVSAAHDELLAAIRDNQVVVIAGETGSGKTTQIPKLCMELGLGVDGLIGHTQPRRIAARAVAARLAEETELELGKGIGYQVRFTAEVTDATRVKVMTDGILLAELQHDKYLRDYQVIIIDEAHERSLNIDFLLGFLARLLPKRPDLKLIITSATIDPESFATHFATPAGEPAPVISVSGRTYPVEVRYRPVGQDAREAAAHDPEADPDHDPLADVPADQTEGVLAAFDELRGEAPGDILVFLSGEREIRDTADALGSHISRLRGIDSRWEVVPLFGRLSTADQQRVFARHSNPRLVLATNVAETSLTVPGIKYVIDAGTARISRYSPRTKVQRLPIERISQASANQRKGRSGRTSDGICIRLYSEEDFATRPEFTDPEILRTNLASVVLSMCSLGLAASAAEVLGFPFLTKPDSRAVREGIGMLTELGALREETGDHTARGSGAQGPGGTARLRLTKLGHTLARLPIDPRMGRILLAGAEAGCGAEAAVIVAALSIQDPRERPQEEREKAKGLHARFTRPRSDFLSWLALWDYITEQSHELSTSKFRKMCKAEFLHFVRIREWQDFVHQLRSLLGNAGIHIDRPDARRLSSGAAVAPGPAGADAVGRADKGAKSSYGPQEVALHQALLTGLLSMIGQKQVDGRDYNGVRGTKFAIFPGSALFKRNPDLVMAAELVETSRLWARTVAQIEPEWVVAVAGDLIKHQYLEPHWSKRNASVMAFDRMSLYGLTLISDKQVGYGRIDPAYSREIFIREALIAGDWNARHGFLRHNARIIAEAEELASRVRDRRMLAADDVLFEFYDARLPATVVSGAHFDAWWKKEPDKHLLDLRVEQLLAQEATTGDVAADYPLEWALPGATARLHYAYDPGTNADGVTVEIPASAAGAFDPRVFSWQVPGLRAELVTALIRSLPKAKRRYFVPAPDVAAQILPGLRPYEGELTEVLAAELTARAGGGELHDLVPITVAPADFDLARVPAHLRMGFEFTTGRGKRKRTVARGTDVVELSARLAEENERRANQDTAGAAPTGNAAPKSGRQGAVTSGKRAAGAAATTQPIAFTPVRDAVDWVFGTIPERAQAGKRVLMPGLHDDGTSASLHAYAHAGDAHRHQLRGLARLISLRSSDALDYASGTLSNKDKLLLGGHRDKANDPLTGALYAAVYRLVGQAAASRSEDPLAGVPVRTAEQFHTLIRTVNEGIVAAVERSLAQAVRIYTLHDEAAKLVSGSQSLAILANLSDIGNQLSRLVHPGMFVETAADRLDRLPVYLQAAAHRAERLGQQAARDKQLMDRVTLVAEQVEKKARNTLGAEHAADIRTRSNLLPEPWQDVLWDVEELRVSLFAPHLGTAHTVSEQRIAKALAKL
jgi:ATP-dependent helicase HrpA